MMDKLLPINFIHLTKEEFQFGKRYQIFPRLIQFTETDSVKNICLRIFKDLRETIKDLLYMQNYHGLLMQEDFK